jgi:type IV pilus assembly protein PilB
MPPSKVTVELAQGGALSIIALVSYLIEEAEESRSSDIHIDPTFDNLQIRVRTDGVLRDAYQFPKHLHAEIVSRIKVLARLRTDEHQATQDGRFRHILTTEMEFVDIRVSVVPTYHGETVVMRLLSDKAEGFNLETLGFSLSDQKKINKAIRRPNGMILATGPTGSGKTTTLYTLIKMLNAPEVSVVTIEDPIEYAINNIKQIQVNSRTSLTFANGLRSILRQDPNIIMVGEIRDAETANIAVNTALTGHQLLSTLHTNDAATTLPRLLDMGVEPYLVASTVNIAIGQRLARKICLGCKELVDLTPTQIESLATLKLPNSIVLEKVYRGKGCALCLQSGYLGRLSINEVLVADDDIREAILQKRSSLELKQIACCNGMTTMMEDGFHKVAQGLTTIEEVLRIFHE